AHTYNALKVTLNGNNGSGKYYNNTSSAGTFTALNNDAAVRDLKNDLHVPDGKDVVMAVKTSGSTITQIFTVNCWDPDNNKTKNQVVEESDLSSITNKQTLLGKDFLKDNDGQADEKTFTLVGVDQLSDIADDDVVFVYADNQDKIRRIEVGTEKVEGTVDSFTTGSAYETNADGYKTKWGKPGTAVIDGTSYKTSYAYISDDPDAGTLDEWVSDDSDNPVEVGDLIKAYLDASGNIYQVEMSEAGSSSYAMVMDYDIYGYEGSLLTEDRTIINESGLNGSGSMVSLMTSTGSVITLNFKNDAKIKDDTNGLGDASVIHVGDIVTYDLNSSGRIRTIRIKAVSAIDDTKNGVVVNPLIDVWANSDITKKGYWDGTAINESATIFSVDRFKYRDNYIPGLDTYPRIWIDDDDAGVIKYENALDTDDVGGYAYYVKNNKIASIVVDGNAVSSSKSFGFLTSWTALSSDHSSGCSYQVTTLIDGESATYYYDVDEDPFFDLKKVFVQFKFGANGYINEILVPQNSTFKAIFDEADDTKDLDLLGFAQAGVALVDGDFKVYNEDGITFRNGGVAVADGIVINVDKDARYYEWKGGSGNMANSTKSDVESADNGKWVLYFDTADENDDTDGIIDVVVMLAKNASGAEMVRYNGGVIANNAADIDADDEDDEVSLDVAS
ncbi:MAG: hypothetical protein IK123_06655, partial [Lachnospiraceae bacterium]|nr:hypothetical protein [Lachnospiraceae bacterium]